MIWIQLTEVALVGETVKEIPCLTDPTDFSLLQQGTQMINRLPVVGQSNTMPCTVINYKAGRKIAVKETFAEIQQLVAAATANG